MDDQDLVVTLYNSLFNQIILVKTLGLVKVYQAEVPPLSSTQACYESYKLI